HGVALGDAHGDLGAREERAVHRAAAGDLEEPGPLFIGQVADQLDIEVEAIAALRAAHLLVAHPRDDLLERPLLPIRVHPQRDRGARPERRRHELVRGRPRIRSADGFRLVRPEPVAPDRDLGRVARTAGAYDDAVLDRARRTGLHAWTLLIRFHHSAPAGRRPLVVPPIPEPGSAPPGHGPHGPSPPDPAPRPRTPENRRQPRWFPAWSTTLGRRPVRPPDSGVRRPEWTRAPWVCYIYTRITEPGDVHQRAAAPGAGPGAPSPPAARRGGRPRRRSRERGRPAGPMSSDLFRR